MNEIRKDLGSLVSKEGKGEAHGRVVNRERYRYSLCHRMLHSGRVL